MHTEGVSLIQIITWLGWLKRLTNYSSSRKQYLIEEEEEKEGE